MPKTVLGVSFAHGEALTVHLQGGWKGGTITRVDHIPLAGGTVDEHGSALLAADLPKADAVVACMPTDRAFQRLVELPFSDRARVEQTAPLEAEESLPLPLEDTISHVQILEKSSSGCRALVVATPRRALEEVLDLYHAGGLTPLSVDVAALALAAVVRPSLTADAWAVVIDLSPQLCQAVLVGPSGPWAFHAFSHEGGESGLYAEVAAVIDSWSERFMPPQHVYLSGPGALDEDCDHWFEQLGIPVEPLPFPDRLVTLHSDNGHKWPGWAIPLGLALKEGYVKGASSINLLQGPFAPHRETGPWRRAATLAAVYACISLVLWGGGVYTRIASKEAQYEALKIAVRDTFRRALPNTPARLELDQMRNKVEELEERANSLGSLVDREVSPLRILRELSARVPKGIEVEFRDLTVEEARVRIEGMTTSFDAIDKITADLAQYPRFVSVVVSDAKAGVERDKVIFKLTINLGRKG